MVTPFHQYASVPLSRPTAAVRECLMADPAEMVSTATATALSRLEPLVRSWGLSPTTLPTVTAARTGSDAIGSVDLRWSGNEDQTVWPSLTARLLVVPAHPGTGARLALLSPRSPGAELATIRLDAGHRRRMVNVAMQRFLHDLASQLTAPASMQADGPGVTTFDRRPVFVHHLQTVHLDPDELAHRLTDDPAVLAADVTTAAINAAAEPLAAGRFRAPATPRADVHETPAGQLGVLELGWASDEEATGWPRMSLVLAVEAAPGGSRLAVLSTREPGYDLSLNRIDKHQRDQVIRDVGYHVTEAILGRLPSVSARPSMLAGDSLAMR